MRALVLFAITLLCVGCGDDRHYAHLVVRTTVLRGAAALSGATVKLTPTPNDGAHSTGKESAPFTLEEPIVQPCTQDELEKCPRGTVTTDAKGLGTLLLQAPDPRKDYEEDEKHPERERHPGRYAKSVMISVTNNNVVTEQGFTFQKDEPLWRFHRDGATDDATACTFDSDYTRCILDVTVTVP